MRPSFSPRNLLRSFLSDQTPIPQPAQQLVHQPFLHLDSNRIHNPLTDKNLLPEDAGYKELRKIVLQELNLSELLPAVRATLEQDSWIVPADVDYSKDFYLKYAEVETNTYCNQSCYFCPVSVHQRPKESMPLELFERVIEQLAEYREQLLIVNLFRYNEPTVEKRLVDLVRIVREHGLPPAMNTNATGLSPKRCDELIAAGGLRFMSINLSTMNAARYAEDRGRDQLELVLRNLDYLATHPIAERIDLAVLGRNDENHQQDYDDICSHFSGSQFNIRKFTVMDRAGKLGEGEKPEISYQTLCGCEQSGSRPLQWIHVSPSGKCVLCCQDYDEDNIVGDLTTHTLNEVLGSKKFAQMRRWVYGLEEAPENFICRKCVFARTKQG